ncbi:MAG TPA: pyridoxal 5'-phosphate synthase glutaminase subunit PdxT [Sporomusa sp.]|nr:pyridoxal 5'-phosphate synthase glutaminase subunit PdxT [Sporomusa sp.]HWR43611.1 pyridoxal 5'-phosphate synthase glutaminase subunit PdxT [Sporomusa sp.]
MTIGVLALQGAVQEHLNCLNSLPDVAGVTVKKAADLENIDGLILPGGESTTMGKLLREFKLTEIIIDKIRSGMPVWGTCAGMILLAKSVVGEATCHLGLMDITVQRNAYGSQLNSFTTNLLIPDISSSSIPLVFIRAPYVESVGAGVKVLATVDDKIVAVEQNNMMATAFHPELTSCLTFHSYFAEKVKSSKSLPS